MTTRAVSSFKVTGWDQTPYGEQAPGQLLSRATVGKSFEGDMVAESTAELLMCQADQKDLKAGAGYVASELVPALLLAIFLDRRFIKVEERMLAEKFGEAWRTYRGRTRRWL